MLISQNPTPCLCRVSWIAVPAFLSALVLFLPRPTAAADYYWNGTTNNFWNFSSSGTNWSRSATALVDPLALPGNNNNANSDTVSFFAFPAGPGGFNTELGADTTITSLTFLSSLPGAPTAGVDGGGAFFLTVGSGGLSDQQGNGTITLSANTSLGAAQVWTNISGNSVIVSGVLSGASGSNITYVGSGSFNLSNADTYGGSTTLGIGAGSGLIGSGLTTLTLSGAGGSLLNTSAITINDGASLSLDSSAANQTSQNRIADSLGITSNGGALNLLGNGSAATTETLGTLALGSGLTSVNVTPGNGQTATLTFGSASLTSFSRGVAGGSVNFSNTANGAIEAPNVALDNGSLLGGWATIGNLVGANTASGANVLDFATVSGGNVVATTNYANHNALADFATNNNVKLSGGTVATPTAITLTAATTTINTLYLTGASQIYFGSGAHGSSQSGNTLVINSGAIISNGATGTAGVSNQPTLTQIATIGSNFNPANANGPTYQGVITSGNGTDLIVDTASNLRINSVVANNGLTPIGLTKNGSGLLDLSDGNNQSQLGPSPEIKNTFTGPVTINAGTLLVNDDLNLGAAPMSFNAAALVLNGGTLLTTRGFAFASNRGITVGPSGGTLAYEGGSTWTISQKITGPGSVTFSAQPLGFNNSLVSDQITLNSVPGANNYQGATTLNTAVNSSQPTGAATIFWNAANQIPSTSAVTITGSPGTGKVAVTNNPAGIDFNGQTQTFGSLGSAAGVGVITNLGAFTTGENNLSTSYGGTIAGGGSFTKVGSGTQTLSGSNTYSGGTVITAGMLQVSNTSGSGTGTGNVIVSGSGVLSGSGFIVPSSGHGVTVQNGGAISGVAGSLLTINGTLNFVAGTLAPQAEFTLPSTNGSSTPLIQATTLSAAGTVTVTITNSTLASGTYDLIGYSSGPSAANPAANFVLASSVPSGYIWTLTTTGSSNGQLDLQVESRSQPNLTSYNGASGTPGTVFGAPVTWSVQSNATTSGAKSYAGLASQVSGQSTGGAESANGYGPLLQSTDQTAGGTVAGGQTLSAQILAGSNSGSFTAGSPATVSMAWRNRTLPETSSAEGGTPASPPLGSGGPLTSNVLSLSGMNSIAMGNAEPVETDPFVLQMSYDAALLGNEGTDTKNGAIFLVWLNPNASSGPTWQNAVAGNFGAAGALAQTNFQGSFDSFIEAAEAADPNAATDFPGDPTAAGLTASELNLLLGSWGADSTNHDVWAVLDHNSQFAVVPEPSSLFLAAFGLLGVAGRLVCRRTRHARISADGSRRGSYTAFCDYKPVQ